MKSTGIVRNIDALGRIVLPKELRNNMAIGADTPLEVFVEGEYVLLKKYRPVGSCEFCGEINEKSVQLDGKYICPACRKKIAAL